MAIGPEDEENLKKARAEDEENLKKPGAEDDNGSNSEREDKPEEKVPQMSEYEKTKLRNIAENKALMDKLGLGGGAKETFKGGSKGRSKKKEKKEKPTSTRQQ